MWRFDDGGSLVYDWQAKSYTISLPSGTVTIKVGATQAEVTDSAVTVKSSTINLEAAVNIKGPVNIDGPLHATQDIRSDGAIIDTTGNTPNHKH